MQLENNQRTNRKKRDADSAGIGGGEMPPVNKLAVVPLVIEYKMEYRSHTDDAWYTAGVMIEGETLRIKYYNFSDDADSVFMLSDFRSLKDIEEFGERFRTLSKQVQDDECGKLLVQKSRHSYKEEEPTEELCLCTFILFWSHGPNAGKLTNAKIENICLVEPSLELDPVVASFLSMAKEREKSISSSCIKMSEGVPGWEVVVYNDGKSRSAGKLGYFERMLKENRCARRSVVEVCPPEVSYDDRRMDDSDLEGIKNVCMILVGNLDKQLCPSTVTEFLRRHTSVSASVFIFPSLASVIYTTGAIMFDSEQDFQKLCDFLNNPNHIITSSTGRPWVIIEKLVGHNKIKGSIGALVPISKNILQKGKNGKRNDLKIVCSGTKEFQIASDLRDLFLAFSDHQERLHKRLYLEETKIFAAR